MVYYHPAGFLERMKFGRGLRPARSFALVTPLLNGMKGRSACRAPLSRPASPLGGFRAALLAWLARKVARNAE